MIRQIYISYHIERLQVNSLTIPTPSTLDVKPIWQSLSDAHRHLAELKGLCESLPNRAILLDTLSIQEAKDSSEIENIITTHDELYTHDRSTSVSPAVKEVQNYIAALRVGYEDVQESGLIRMNTILRVQEKVEQNNAGLRKVPGMVLKNQHTGAVIYEPPQDATVIESLMAQLVDFIHADDGLDPLLRMAIAHHQFESIHPFYDGNGRTGRILNLLMMQREALLDLPVLYLSRYIISTKAQYCAIPCPSFTARNCSITYSAPRTPRSNSSRKTLAFPASRQPSILKA